MARVFLLAAVLSAAATGALSAADAPEEGFRLSYTAGHSDAAGRFMGGTELRNLQAHGGKLYAGVGYWEDRPGPEGLQGMQILVLERPDGHWRVDHSFDQRLPNGRPRHLAISALRDVTFATDGAGDALPRAVSILLAGSWDLSGSSEVFSRDDRTGGWTAMPLAGKRVPQGKIQQIRSIAGHRDRLTGVDHVFVGNDPYGIYRGHYDPSARGGIRWASEPELEIGAIKIEVYSGLSLPRVSGMAECNGVLFATIGHQLYRRVDGAVPRWELLYTNPKPGHSETGLRGLTAIPDPSGQDQTLLLAVEGSAARVLRVDPATGQETTEVDLIAHLSRTWQTRISYVIAGYNDMTLVPAPGGGTAVLIGFEAFIPPAAPTPPGHQKVDGLEAGAWYFVRQPDRRYDLRKIAGRHPTTGRHLVATRTIAPSPFSDEPDAIYFGGFDANKLPAHNTAWAFKTTRANALRPARP